MLGDSHVHRMAAYRQFALERLETVELRFIGKGGSGLQYIIDNSDLAHGYDIVILMTGGNDLHNGASLTQMITDYSYATALLMAEGVQQIVITALWPRKDAAYNSAARLLAERMEARYFGHPVITHWLVDRRQSFYTYDGVHLVTDGYRHATQFLSAAIIWVLRHHGYF